MSTLIGTIYSSTWFSFNRSTGTFTSSITETPAVLRQLWHDDFDLGFGIRSAITGVVVLYTVCGVTRDDEGDVKFWEFELTPFSTERVPHAVGTKVRVYNT